MASRLIMVMLVTTFLSALGLGLMLAVFMDRLATGNMAGSVAMLYAADAGDRARGARSGASRRLERRARRARSAAASPTGCAGGVRGHSRRRRRRSHGRHQPVELRQGHQLHQCADEREFDGAAVGREQSALAAVCVRADGAIRRSLRGRRRVTSRCGLRTMAVSRTAIRWPMQSRRGQPGHGIVRVHAEAFGLAGSRRAIEAELSRVCPGGEDAGCLPGIRVQSWQELRQAIP